jgi:hypothetical protein
VRAFGLRYIGTSTGGYSYLETPPASFEGPSFRLSDGTLALRSSCRMGRMTVDLRYEAAHNEGEDAEEVVFYPRFSMIDAVEDSLLIIGFKQERYFTYPISPRGPSFRYERTAYNLSADPYGNAAAIRRLIESGAAGGTSENDEKIYLLSVRTLKVVALI